MDGTLLDENGKVPEETYELIRELRALGIRFAASSSRRYDTLCEYFEPVKDQMDFVASNGAQVYVDGQLVDREVYSHASVRRLESVVNYFDCLHLVLFDRKVSYLTDDSELYIRELDKDLPNIQQVHKIPGPEVSILKASVFCDDAAQRMEMAYALDRELGDKFVFAPSGKNWIDCMQVGVNKASGIQQVMQAHGVTADETMAFGDSMNDYEILRLVKYSRAMGNGHYAIKQIAQKTIGTNAEHAVQKEIARVIKERQAERELRG